MQLTKMEESINSHTAVNADRVIGEVNSAIQKFTEEQNNELIFVWNDGVDKTLRQMDLLNSSLQHHINQVAVTSLENDFKVNVKNCELRIDKLLRSYELYLHGQPIVWEIEFSQVNDLVLSMNATLELVKENMGDGGAIHEFNALLVEGRLAMTELIIRACAADGFVVCKNHLVRESSTGESYCLRVAKWILSWETEFG